MHKLISLIKTHSLIFFAFIVLLAVSIFFVFNHGYFYAQVAYYLKPLPPKTQTSAGEEQLAKPNWLEISSLSIEAPVIYEVEKNEEAFQRALASGVVHFPDTALPGQSGNVYIFGHSSDYAWSDGKYKNIFALLPHIKVGEEVILSSSEGKVFKYKVIEKKVVSPDDLSVLAQDSARSLLTLQTSYPIGTALRRYIVVCELSK